MGCGLLAIETLLEAGVIVSAQADRPIPPRIGLRSTYVMQASRADSVSRPGS